ncbi:hypothetical protein P154DRAFT_113990 [Amniculicola lignicola CBS 123094]|uniref:Uncharacterized protein n=1 Tax=Amniculicola lignicola CBS 123094 TaxID=1392246 RepID=A0A6A5W154_9PLEO|nr:hypothetical protein P154DRAFT_113990 [Amniculicola lignicola CBS 123094]
MPSKPAKPTDCSAWLIEELKIHIITFDDDTTSLLKGQEQAFGQCSNLLRENAEGFTNHSKAGRSILHRASEFLKDIFQAMGSEVFLLCTFVHRTKLGQDAHKIRLSRIQIWWNSTAHPKGLVTVATKLCDGEFFLLIFVRLGRLARSVRGGSTTVSPCARTEPQRFYNQ